MGYFLSNLTSPRPSTGSPVTLKMRPSTPLPTGTEMGAPVSTTSMPRFRPSEEDMAMAAEPARLAQVAAAPERQHFLLAADL